MTERDRTPDQRRERERIEEHFARGRALGETLTAAADHPRQIYALALNALDTADLPTVQADAGQVALLMGIVSACAEWVTADEPPPPPTPTSGKVYGGGHVPSKPPTTHCRS